MSVAQAFERERPRLLPLPDNPFVTDERIEAKVGKTPYVRFDLNDYSVPHTFVRRTVTVVASLTRVRIVHGAELIAQHRRGFGKGEQIENPDHVQALVQAKRAARQHRALDRLGAAVPAACAFIEQAAANEATLQSTVRELERLLDDYGARELELALAEVIQRGPCHPNGVRQVLQRRRDEQQLPPPLTLSLPDNDKAKNIYVRSPSLHVYDQLHNTEDTDHDERS